MACALWKIGQRLEAAGGTVFAPEGARCDKIADERQQFLAGGAKCRANRRRQSPPESRTGYGQTAYKRRLAYQYLGINPNDVQTAAFFRINLHLIARSINQGRADRTIHPFDYLQSSEDPDARKVVDVFLSVPESYRKLLPPEAYCQAAGVSPYRVLEIITGLAVRFGAEISSILVAVMLPRVVQKTIERALQDKGAQERALMFRTTGLLPPRGCR